jgi:hypothetical protein
MAGSTVLTQTRLDKHEARKLARALPLGEARALVGLVFKEWPHNGAGLDEWNELEKKGLVVSNFKITPKGKQVAKAVHTLVKEEWD